MRIGVIGAGRIGGNAARLWAAAGHDLMLSYSRDPAKLERAAADIGGRAGTPAEAAAFGHLGHRRVEDRGVGGLRPRTAARTRGRRTRRGIFP